MKLKPCQNTNNHFHHALLWNKLLRQFLQTEWDRDLQTIIFFSCHFSTPNIPNAPCLNLVCRRDLKGDSPIYRSPDPPPLLMHSLMLGPVHTSGSSASVSKKSQPRRQQGGHEREEEEEREGWRAMQNKLPPKSSHPQLYFPVEKPGVWGGRAPCPYNAPQRGAEVTEMSA